MGGDKPSTKNPGGRAASAALPPSRVLDILRLSARLTARLGDGREVFIKADAGDGHPEELARRDRACLDVLKGLAVPRRVELAMRDVRALAGGRASCCVVSERVPGDALDRAGFSSAELLGAWAFVAEQLVAFRRHQILYSDVKCSNVLAARRPLRVTIVDFDCATVLRSDDVYRGSQLGMTPGFEAPEQVSAPKVSERSVVYQLGMLLAHTMVGASNDTLKDERRGLPALSRRLRDLRAPALARLAASALEAQPQRRPESLERVWRGVREAGLPGASERFWRRLREPHAERLRGLGLTV